jgi:hypothetical protein
MASCHHRAYTVDRSGGKIEAGTMKPGPARFGEYQEPIATERPDGLWDLEMVSGVWGTKQKFSKLTMSDVELAARQHGHSEVVFQFRDGSSDRRLV